jgi:hypothetical protein
MKQLETFNASSLEINTQDLSSEFTHQAAMYAHWSRLQAQAEAMVNTLANEKDLEYAAADSEYRQQLISRGEKFTEKVIEGLVLRDDDYQQVVEAWLKAKELYQTLRGVTYAFSMRADMLVSLGAHLRAEATMAGMHINSAADVAFRAKLQELAEAK